MRTKKEGRLIILIGRPSRNDRTRRLFHPIAFEFAVKRGDADSQQTGGFGFVAVREFEHFENMAAFEVFERERVVS